MKFSVLIPTRNRLTYLQYAVQSVLDQDYQDWEIIISDNDSEEDIKSYVDSLNDPRIIYTKTSTFISVTDNWNRAFDFSTGDYILMLGDDDCILKGYFSKLIGLIKRHQNPDLLFYSAYLYCYPGVLVDHPNGQLHQWGNACFLEKKKSPFILEKKKR